MKPFIRRTLMIVVPLSLGGAAFFASSLRAARAAQIAAGEEITLIEAAAPLAEAARDERAVALLNNFIKALQLPDEAARVQACLPLLHRSLLADDKRDIEATTKKFAWTKAVKNAANYAAPIEITRLRAKGTLTLEEGDHPERGRAEDYFIAKKAGISGLAASITLFFPENGAPKILYFGSL